MWCNRASGSNRRSNKRAEYFSAVTFTFRAPTRIDFGGGWTDVPPYDVEQGGYVCNVAISRYATVRVRPASQQSGVEVSVQRSADATLLNAAAARFSVR